MNMALAKLSSGARVWSPLATPPISKSRVYCKHSLNVHNSSPHQPSLHNIGNNGVHSNGLPPTVQVLETTDVWVNANSATGLSNVNEHTITGFQTQPTITETADVYDSNSTLLGTGELRVLLPLFRSYGGRRAFSGQVVTIKGFEDNAIVVETVLEIKEDGEPLGKGKVLVVDGGGSLRRSMVGSVLTKMAHKMGWVGVVVNGCIRDIDEVNSIDIGIRALGSVPVRSSKKGGGEKRVPVQIAGALIRDGDWLCADNSGILVASCELSVLGATYRPVLTKTPEGLSVYTHVLADYTCPVEPRRLFNAHCLDDHNFMPKFLPETFRSIEFVRGVAAAVATVAVGSIKHINFAKGSAFKYVKNKVEELDIENMYIKYRSIEGDILGNKWDSIVYEIKIGASSTGSHFKMTACYNAKRDAMITENDVNVHREELKNIHKAIEEFLLLYPNLYA